MDIHFTARKFKAHRDVRDHAFVSIKRLDDYYDGIRRSDIVLSFERKPKSIKTAEINVHVNRTILSAKEVSEDFIKSIDLALEKIERQLGKYKSRLRQKDKVKLRRMKESIPRSEEE